MSIPGKLLLHAWHRPVGILRNLIAAGGPLVARRTEIGRQEMERAAWTLPLLPPHDGKPLELHLLTGRHFWYQTAFCLWTFSWHAGRPVAPVLYDDGTLSNEYREALARLFPLARIVTQADTLARLDTCLPVDRYPVVRERWLNYPNIRKLTDPHIGSTGWKLVIDSDLLFFSRPSLLLDWLDAPKTPLHAVDVADAYGYSATLLASLANATLPQKLNVGLCGLRSEELDWDRIEHICRTLIAAERTNYYLEQAIVAILLAARPCTIAPAKEYVTLPVPPEAMACRAVMHHYVAHSKRWYFQNNWRHCLEQVPGNKK